MPQIIIEVKKGSPHNSCIPSQVVASQSLKDVVDGLLSPGSERIANAKMAAKLLRQARSPEASGGTAPEVSVAPFILETCERTIGGGIFPCTL